MNKTIKMAGTLGVAQSICEICRKIVPAKVATDDKNIYFEKFCSEHGSQRSIVDRDISAYLETQRFVKPAWIPRESSGSTEKPCPQGCGFCQRHEQHLCMPIVEITSKCNLSCPVCIADAGGDWEMTLEEFCKLMDGLIRTERQIDILNLSGGEPLLHSHLLDIVDHALARPEIVRVSISTNGLVLLEQPQLIRELHRRNVVVAFQFDGFDDKIYEALRGRKLLKQKSEILDLLASVGIATSLTVTAANGINTDQLQKITDYLFTQPHIISVMIQPMSFAGRAVSFSSQIDRTTISDVLEALDSNGNGRVMASDFVPLPCGHPLCFRLAYYLMLDDGGSVSLNKIIDSFRMMDTLANRTVFGLDNQEYEKLKDLVYEIWSGPCGCAPDSEKVMTTLRSILDEISRTGFEPRKAFTIAQRRIKSIFIHSFQDAGNFDLSRVRRCCQAYPQVDGRLMPICVHNVLGRKSNSFKTEGANL